MYCHPERSASAVEGSCIYKLIFFSALPLEFPSVLAIEEQRHGAAAGVGGDDGGDVVHPHAGKVGGKSMEDFGMDKESVRF